MSAERWKRQKTKLFKAPAYIPIVFLILLANAVYLHFASKALAQEGDIILSEYIAGSGFQRHKLSTGEEIWFTTEGGSGPGEPVRMHKGGNYEQFYVGNGTTYRAQDTSWAPKPGFGDAHCTNGNKAVYTLAPGCQNYSDGQNVSGDGVMWAPSSKNVDGTWSTGTHQIVTLDNNALSSGQKKYCNLSDLSGYGGTSTCGVSAQLKLLEFYKAGDFTFCTGLTNDADMIVVEVISGPGAGDTFYFMKGWGLVGFQAPGFAAGLSGEGANDALCQNSVGSGTPSDPNDASNDNSRLADNQNARNPQPDPYVPCHEVRPEVAQIELPIFGKLDISLGALPEFHSLRPYQASPCGEAPGLSPAQPQALLCGNDLYFKEKFTRTPNSPDANCTQSSNGSQTCTFNISSTVDVTIDLTESELPIMGNTDDVGHGWSVSSDLASEVDRVNEYLSWYLQGTLYRAEDFALGPSPIDQQRIVDFAGPLNKLLPQRVQWDKRENSIRKARESVTLKSTSRHNQVVGCIAQTGFLGGLTVWPCNTNSQFSLGDFLKTFNSATTLFGRQVFRLDDWVDKGLNLPPIQENFKRFEDYWKAYLEWRGQACTPSLEIGGRSLYVCIQTVPNFYAWLFPYVPYTNNEDAKGEVRFVADEFAEGESPTLVPQYDPNVKSLSFTPRGDNKKYLYFPHMREGANLSRIVQETYVPKGQSGYSGESGGGKPYFTGGCEVLESRTNPGDDLFGEHIENDDDVLGGDLTYTTEFTCDFPITREPAFCEANCDGNQLCINSCLNPVESCETEITVNAGSVYTKTPRIREIYERIVDGDFSLFKRFYPQIGPGSPIEEIFDVPAVAEADYQTTPGSGESTQTFAGHLSTQRSGESAQIFFPHIGSIYEYGIIGIQNALRPKGYARAPEASVSTKAGEPTAPWPNYSSADSSTDVLFGPGADPNIPTTGGSCSKDFLSPIWGSDTDGAACVCQQESGGRTNALNNGCLSVGGSYDYSLGLFQINFLAHCPEAFSSKGTTDANYKMVVPCVIGNQDALQACINKYSDGASNATYGKQLKDARGNWGDWVKAAGICGLPH